MMAKQGVKGKICFVSSTLGYMGLLGYASYSPGKHALMGVFTCDFGGSSTESRRPSGLVESLRFELALYDIDVQVFAPCTMYSPGYENEQRSKPTITKKIEESDEGLSPEQAARAMLAGVHTA
jgi:3-dehydrosphinganine reductase